MKEVYIKKNEENNIINNKYYSEQINKSSTFNIKETEYNMKYENIINNINDNNINNKNDNNIENINNNNENNINNINEDNINNKNDENNIENNINNIHENNINNKNDNNIENINNNNKNDINNINENNIENNINNVNENNINNKNNIENNINNVNDNNINNINNNNNNIKNNINNEKKYCDVCNQIVNENKYCPICLKYNIKKYYCSQKCLQNSWKEHQIIHNNNGNNIDIKNENEKYNHEELVKMFLYPQFYDPKKTSYWFYDKHLIKFINFKFTGKLRPWPLSPKNYAPDFIEKPDYAITSISYLELRESKKTDIHVNTEEQIKGIKEACILGRKVLDYAHSLVRPNITTDEIDQKVHEFIINHNAYPSTLNYYKFPKSCCTSVNEVICHGIPDKRPLQKGDIVNIDISVYYKGYHSDLNETYFVGNVEKDISKEAKLLVKTCYFSLMEVIKRCKPGMLYKNIGNFIHAYVSKNNFSVVRTYSGHGTGVLFHSNPTIPHFKNNKAIGIMKPGHVFTIEPMINEGNHKDILWPDNWTSVTSDGKLSAQFEHTLLVTENGVEILTKRTNESPSLGFDTKDNLYY